MRLSITGCMDDAYIHDENIYDACIHDAYIQDAWRIHDENIHDACIHDAWIKLTDGRIYWCKKLKWRIWLPVKQFLSKGKVSNCHCRCVPNKQAEQLRQNIGIMLSLNILMPVESHWPAILSCHASSIPPLPTFGEKWVIGWATF